MKTILCTTCKQEKSETDFYIRSENKRQRTHCKLCLSQYYKERWVSKKKQAVAYKGGKCVDCQQSFDYYLYDFHHINPSEKEYDWGKLRLFSWHRIQKELDKCVLLCVMCHRIREYQKST